MLQKRCILLICSLILSAYTLSAQVGSKSIYKFLDLHPSARVAAMGGHLISVMDNDLNLGLQNPALLNRSMHKQIAYNTVNYLSDINSGYAAYAHHFDSLGTFSAGIQYINYGKFQGMTPQGVPTGTFTAGEYNLVLGMGRQWKKFSYGANLKMIYSALEQYKSYGVALDLGGSYNNENKLFTAALVARNLGYQLSSYHSDKREPLPFEIQAAVSKKLKHMPLRLSLLYNNLQRFDLTYKNPNKPGQQIDLSTGLPVEEKISLGDKFMRHFVLGGEFLFSQNFNIRFGYNHLRRKELTIDSKKGLVGFSWGFGLRINRFHVSYGSSSFYVGQNTNHFSIITNLDKFKKKKVKTSQ